MSAAAPWLSHAEALLRQRHLTAAISCFGIAERKGADPDQCAAGRWTAHMLLGRFPAAWKESDSIRTRGAPDPHRFWNGEDLHGRKIIVRCLHGLGDAVQFLRYIPALRRVAEAVVIEVPPAMLELAQMVDGVDEAIAWDEHALEAAPAWDVQVEITELPYIFRTRLEDLPIAEQYIRIPEVRRREFRMDVAPGRIQVGVVWSSAEWNPSRSIPLKELRSVLSTPGFDFWNLQGGKEREAWKMLSPNASLYDAPAACADAGLVPLAAFLSQLDLVITVDTLAAHLAGAMGIPAWVLLQQKADWRWMDGRNDSPWYPSLSLFRQSRHGDWKKVALQVRRALVDWRDRHVTRKAAA